MTFIFTTNNRIINRYDGANFQEEVLTLSGLDGITVTADSTKFTISGQQAATNSAIASGDAAAVASGSAALATYSGFAETRFVNTAGDTMTGFLTLNADPTASGHASTKQYVDAQVAAASGYLTVQENNATVYTGPVQLDFGHALDVTSGTGEAVVAVDETEFTSVVFLTGTQTISGDKTFANNVVVTGDFTVNGTTTTLNTEQLLVEDNIVTLNSTVTGSPALNAGLIVERGTSTDSWLIWNETADYWAAGLSGVLGTDYHKIILQPDLDSAIATLSGNVNADLIAASGVLRAYTNTVGAAAVASGVASLASYSGYAEGAFVNVAGDTMTGNLTLASGIDLLAAVSGTSDLGSAASPFAFGYFDFAFGYQTPTTGTHLANKAYVDAQVIAASYITVQENNSTIYTGAIALDFGTGFDVASGTGEAVITLDLSETDAVRTANVNQSISGTKTFLSPIVVASGLEPASGTATGAEGEVRFSDDFLYIAVAANTWKRVALGMF